MSGREIRTLADIPYLSISKIASLLLEFKTRKVKIYIHEHVQKSCICTGIKWFRGHGAKIFRIYQGKALVGFMKSVKSFLWIKGFAQSIINTENQFPQ